MAKVFSCQGEIEFRLKQEHDGYQYTSAKLELVIRQGGNELKIAAVPLSEEVYLFKGFGSGVVKENLLNLIPERDRLEKLAKEQEQVIADLTSPEGDGPNAKTYRDGMRAERRRMEPLLKLLAERYFMNNDRQNPVYLRLVEELKNANET